MSDPKPNPIDVLLYQTETLKTVLIDNYANRGESRPLMEYRETMMKHADDLATSFIIREDQSMDFETFKKMYYGTL